MKSKYLKGSISGLNYENYEAQWTAWYNIPKLYEGRLYVHPSIAVLLSCTKGQKVPIVVGKRWKQEMFNREK